MAQTYLQLVNDTLSQLNEVPLTSTTFTAARGPQAAAKRAVADAITDIYNAEREWPFNIVSTTQTLTPGVQTYDLPAGYTSIDWDSFFLNTAELLTNGNFTTNINGWTAYVTGTGSAAWNAGGSGNGCARLNAGAAGTAAIEQEIPTISGNTYRLIIRTFYNDVTLTIGTTSGGTDLYSGALTFTNTGGGQFYDVSFSTAGASAFIRFTTTENANSDIDLVNAFDIQPPINLYYMQYDEWRRYYKLTDDRMTPLAYSRPQRVFATNDSKFGVTYKPDKAYVVSYDYWQAPAQLSLYTDTSNIPDRYEPIVIDGALYYMYMFRDNMEQAGVAKKAFDKGIAQMRTDLINKSTKMMTTMYMPPRVRNQGLSYY